MKKSNSPLDEFLKVLMQFIEERDWSQFHSPKNLAMDLASEVGEVIDHFRWLTEEESRNLGDKALSEVREEIGDVFLSLINLSSRLGIDPLQAAKDSLKKIAKRYPVEKAKGKNLKYTAYQE